MVFRRRLSFGQEDAPANIVPASSPETMPGEIFQLDNIVEEPTNPQMPPVNKPKVQAKREEGFNQSIGSSTGQQLETSLTSNTSIPLSDSSVKVCRFCVRSSIRFKRRECNIKMSAYVAYIFKEILSSFLGFEKKIRKKEGKKGRKRRKRKSLYERENYT